MDSYTEKVVFILAARSLWKCKSAMESGPHPVKGFGDVFVSYFMVLLFVFCCFGWCVDLSGGTRIGEECGQYCSDRKCVFADLWFLAREGRKT